MLKKLTRVLDPNRKVRLILELLCYITCIIVTVGQLGLLNYYFIYYLQNNVWYSWIVADCIVLAVMIWLLSIAVRYNHKFWKKHTDDDANLRYAFIVWLVYSIVLSAKISASYFTFGRQQKLDHKEEFGIGFFKLILSLSSFIFLLLVMSHHYTQLNSPRQVLLGYLTSSITLDILDSIQLLNLIFARKHTDQLDDRIEYVVLVFACINFMLPTLALFRLRYRVLPEWVPLPFQEVYTMLYFLMVNVPYLALRIVAFRSEDTHEDTSGFLIKNVIMIFLGIREVWISYLRYKTGKECPPLKGDKSDEADECMQPSQPV